MAAIVLAGTIASGAATWRIYHARCHVEEVPLNLSWTGLAFGLFVAGASVIVMPDSLWWLFAVSGLVVAAFFAVMVGVHGRRLRRLLPVFREAPVEVVPGG